MAEIDAQTVKALRDATGAGMMDCKKALQETEGDFEKAQVWLREKGMSDVGKRKGRSASDGEVHAYIHPGAKTGVLVELNCETDFVAHTTEFQELIHDIALHIAAFKPDYVARDEVPEAEVAKERDFLEKQAAESGKPANIIGKIVEGQMNSFYKRMCLLDQPFVRNDKQTVEEAVHAVAAKVGENLQVRRFALFEVGK